jgi:hypothetical protein
MFLPPFFKNKKERKKEIYSFLEKKNHDKKVKNKKQRNFSNEHFAKSLLTVHL